MPRQLSEQEYQEIRQSVLDHAPAGMDEASFQRYVGPAMEQALGIAENSRAPLQGSSLGRALGGLWKNVNPVPMVSGLASAVTHPVKTATALYDAQKAQFEKAGNAQSLSEKVGYTAAGMLPILGPMAAAAGERGAEGDVAGMVGEGAGILAPFAADAALSMRAARRAPALEAEAVQQVAGKVLAPGNQRYTGRAQQIAPEVLTRRMSGDRGALREAAQSGMDTAATAIDDAIAGAGGPGAMVSVGPVITSLRKELQRLTTSGGDAIEGAAGKVQALRARIGQLQMEASKRGGLVSFEELRKMRDVNYGVADAARGYERAGNVAQGDVGFAAKTTGSAIREEFGNLSPSLKAANADYHFYKTLDEILDPAVGRPKVQGPSQGVTGGARTSGAVAGAMTGSKTVTFITSVVLPWLRERKADPSWQLADATRKMDLANAIRAGNTGKARRLMLEFGAPTLRATSPSESPTTTMSPVQ